MGQSIQYFYYYNGENISPDITHRGDPKQGWTFQYKNKTLIVTRISYEANIIKIFLEKL